MQYSDREKYDESHGSPFDRGSADSWYHRARNPHKGGVGGDSGSKSMETRKENGP